MGDAPDTGNKPLKKCAVPHYYKHIEVGTIYNPRQGESNLVSKVK
jgi:hypothetical protein